MRYLILPLRQLKWKHLNISLHLSEQVKRKISRKPSPGDNDQFRKIQQWISLEGVGVVPYFSKRGGCVQLTKDERIQMLWKIFQDSDIHSKVGRESCATEEITKYSYPVRDWKPHRETVERVLDSLEYFQLDLGRLDSMKVLSREA